MAILRKRKEAKEKEYIKVILYILRI